MLDWLAAQHPDPAKEHWQITASGGTNYYGGKIYDNGINTTRGQAVGAIGELILRDSAYIKRFETTLARMGDAHTVTQLICRTYQQRQQDEWTSRALIDRLCLEGVGDVNDAFGAFDR